ncbi:hypothetical protein [Blastopirellula marina]|uniref:Zinc-finger domain-containing protein n=1 Tax=Blastopirellula marina DSM 3645 TaxID=314230 RepID=A3ZPN2_9BACT|nr:hypothetical protein [Blastopirellula marina]EAQ81710.1 hypothetical protein DSM3645_29052 [Blastopirellula marina DSM 3645]
MNDPYVDRLIQSYLDDSLTEQELVEFESILLQSESVRLRFWELAEVHGLAPQAVAALGLKLENDVVTPARRLPAPPSAGNLWSRKFSFMLLRQSGLTLAGGVLLGALISAFAWPVRGMPEMSTPTSLTTESFESGASPAVAGMPTIADLWSGDFSEVVGTQQGVVPADGEKMLQILRADYDGKPTPEGSYCGDLYRLIDVRSLREQLAKQGTIAHASALFDMSTQPAAEEYRYSVRILALTTDLIANPQQFDPLMIDEYALATARQNVRLDNNPQTWELAQCELRLPAQTDFILIHLGVSYGYAEDDIRRITFPSHYVDDIQISLSNYAH